jgi:hypothetical protein
MNENDATESPDAIEIIFQSALTSDRDGWGELLQCLIFLAPKLTNFG